MAEVRSACEYEMAPSRALEATQRRRAETEAYLAGPVAKRVEKARWADLIKAIGPAPDRPTINPKSEEWLCEYGRKPIAVSDDLRAQLQNRMIPASSDGVR